jgi:endonuclease VIII
MPEGNEIHRYADIHASLFAGKIVFVEGPNGRFAQDAQRLNRKKLRSVEAYGKHLFYDFGPNRHLHIHLGLYGKFRDGDMPYPEMKGALRLRVSTKAHWLELRGPTACEVLSDTKRAALLARIGPDPLRPDADSSAAIARIHTSRSPLAILLMDQSVIGGIGNIYRAELLFRARINPMESGNAQAQRTLRKLWADAQGLMQQGMIDRRIVTTRPADRPHRQGKARRGETHYVYRRRGLLCFVCSSVIQMKSLGGRTLYWCPNCQS